MNMDYDAVAYTLEKKKGGKISKNLGEEKEYIAFYLQHLSYIQNALVTLTYFRKCTIAELAAKTEIDQKIIQDFIDGTDLFTIDMPEFIGISIGLDVPLHWLFTEPNKLRTIIKEKYQVTLPPAESIIEEYAPN